MTNTFKIGSMTNVRTAFSVPKWSQLPLAVDIGTADQVETMYEERSAVDDAAAELATELLRLKSNLEPADQSRVDAAMEDLYSSNRGRLKKAANWTLGLAGTIVSKTLAEVLLRSLI